MGVTGAKPRRPGTSPALCKTKFRGSAIRAIKTPFVSPTEEHEAVWMGGVGKRGRSAFGSSTSTMIASVMVHHHDVTIQGNYRVSGPGINPHYFPRKFCSPTERPWKFFKADAVTLLGSKSVVIQSGLDYSKILPGS